MSEVKKTLVEKPQTKYPINVPMLEGWVQIPDPMKSFHDENAKKFGLYIAGKEMATAETIGYDQRGKASLSYDFDKLYMYEFASIEEAMCAIEELVEFYDNFKKKWDKRKN